MGNFRFNRTYYAMMTHINYIFDIFSVNPNLREHVYCNALRYGNETDFKYLWEKYSTENVVNEQIVILGALGCSDRAEDIKA
jgi:hypothetical protein